MLKYGAGLTIVARRSGARSRRRDQNCSQCAIVEWSFFFFFLSARWSEIKENLTNKSNTSIPLIQLDRTIQQRQLARIFESCVFFFFRRLGMRPVPYHSQPRKQSFRRIPLSRSKKAYRWCGYWWGASWGWVNAQSWTVTRSWLDRTIQLIQTTPPVLIPKTLGTRFGLNNGLNQSKSLLGSGCGTTVCPPQHTSFHKMTNPLVLLPFSPRYQHQYVLLNHREAFHDEDETLHRSFNHWDRPEKTL